MSSINYIDSIALLKESGVINKLPETDEELSAFFLIAEGLKAKHENIWLQTSIEKLRKPAVFENKQEEVVVVERKTENVSVPVTTTRKTIVENDEIEFYIQCPYNKKICVKFDKRATIRRIKDMLARDYGYPRYRQLLLGTDMETMNSKATLEEYKIKIGSVLTLKLLVVE